MTSHRDADRLHVHAQEAAAYPQRDGVILQEGDHPLQEVAERTSLNVQADSRGGRIDVYRLLQPTADLCIAKHAH